MSPQVTLHTARLTLRFADLHSPTDAHELVKLHTSEAAAKSGVPRQIDSPEALRRQLPRLGPKAELCTRAPPPEGMYFLIVLPPPPSSEDGKAEDESKGTVIGMNALVFRPEMPYPDMAYAMNTAYEGHGYASEAGRAALAWWRDVIGVEKIWCGTLPANVRSQRCAERIGFVRAGGVDIVLGNPPDEATRVRDCVAFVLPGMEGEWVEGRTIYPSVRW
ncbi:acyl-CoA N-acyltransferase [Neohortaea acidophila]|uniref:Acyl-CoA N-acyltransferase n=1 Tax=Neohortaea acidophila TaxID=245834 RepID=A0A6A6PRE5_9PEZI|nr:acyl-CoA N-acyltransferase [Neohortaea acidophila]KAF2482562.1 acyl-CoA N-acyltransferase [Neohortaea acidophila]